VAVTLTSPAVLITSLGEYFTTQKVGGYILVATNTDSPFNRY